MSARTFIDKQYTLIKGVTELFCRVSVGAAGAVTLQSYSYPKLGSGILGAYASAPTTGGGTSYPLRYAQGAEGIFSVVRTGTGLWTVTLQDSYQRMVRLAGYVSVAGGASNIVSINENTTITSMGAANGSIIGVSLESSTGTLADPTSGHIVNLAFTLQNMSEP